MGVDGSGVSRQAEWRRGSSFTSQIQNAIGGAEG